MEIYEAIYTRRDVRHFRTDPLPEGALRRILDAAHHAGSVGFMQPWNFIVVRSPETKQQVQDLYRQSSKAAAEQYSGEQRALYDSLKLAGIMEAPVNIAVTCDSNRQKGHALGRVSMPQTDVYSTCCAIQNLWLAARAEGLGIGWVSIVEPEAVKKLLGIPAEVTLVAYLCLGRPVSFDAQPMLEKAGWETRLPLSEVVFEESWQHPLQTI